MIIYLLTFFCLILEAVSFAEQYADPQQDINAVKAPPKDQAFLYDGSSISLVSKKTGNVKLAFDPTTEHTQISQVKDDDKNVASYSLFLMARHTDSTRRMYRYAFPKTMTQSFARNASNYHHVIARLFEHNRHHDDNCANALKAMMDGKKSHVAGQLHHSEQGIMIDLRDHIKDYIFAILTAHPIIDKIYGIIINIYSTNDVCGYCGEMINNVIPLLKADISGFLAAGQYKMPKKFSVLACISSTKPYNNPLYKDVYSNRPPLLPKGLEGYDIDFYRQHSAVAKGPFNVKGLDQKALFFHTPKPEHKKLDGLVLSFLNGQMTLCADQTLEQTHEDLFIFLLNNPPQALRALNLSGYRGKFNRLYLHSHQQLTTAIISGISINHTSFGKNLVELNLCGSLNDIKGKDENDRKEPFKEIAALKKLKTLDVSENNINVVELWYLICGDSHLPVIESVVAKNNCVFDMTDESISRMKSVFSKFFVRRSQPSLDVRMCSTAPQKAFMLLSQEHSEKFRVDSNNVDDLSKDLQAKCNVSQQ